MRDVRGWRVEKKLRWMRYKERPVGDLRREAAERGGVGESALLWCWVGT